MLALYRRLSWSWRLSSWSSSLWWSSIIVVVAVVYVVVGIIAAVVVVTVVGAIVVAIEGADVVVGDVLDQPQVTNHVCFTFAARKMKDGQVLTNFPQTSQCFSSLGQLKKGPRLPMSTLAKILFARKERKGKRKWR